MDNNQGKIDCALGCWLIAALGGFLALVLLWLLGSWTFTQAVFAGAVVFIVVGLLLSLLMCSPLSKIDAIDENETPLAKANAKNAAQAQAQASIASDPAASATPSSDGKEASGETTDAAMAKEGTASSATTVPAKKHEAAAVAVSETVIKPSAELKGTKELSDRKGTWTYEGEKDTGSQQAPASTKTSAKPASKKAKASSNVKTASAKKAAVANDKAPKKAAPKKKAEAKAESVEKPAKAKPAVKEAAKRPPVAADGQPEVLTQPRDGNGDDLKQIKGVGPGLEKTLNELGFFHFDQIAGWRKKEIEWVDSRLKFKGRIERDEWTKQAKILAKGGKTDFSNKVKKGGVY